MARVIVPLSPIAPTVLSPIRRGHLIKKLLIATAFAAISVAPAVAADMAVKAAPVVARPACAAAQFGGFYVGINGGASYHDAVRRDAGNSLISGSDEVIIRSWGGTVGGQAGYNFANCNTLWGIEVDGAWLSNDRFVNSATIFPGGNNETGGFTAGVDGVVTLRGRAGIALDNMLLYVTGGAAAVHTKSLYTHIHQDGTRNDQFRVDEWNWGWVAGFGTEWAFAPNWSVRSEILYIGTPDKSYAGLTTGTTVPSFTVNTNQSDHLYITRVGVNYRFGGPVVAKY